MILKNRMIELVRKFFDWKVKVQYDEKSETYTASHRSKIIFVGNKEECQRFLKVHTISSFVQNDTF